MITPKAQTQPAQQKPTPPLAAAKAIKPIDELRGTLTQMSPQFAAALPAHITVERFVRVVMTALQQTPTLLQCDRTSLFSACMRSAQDGLIPDGREAALVEYKGKVQYVPMIAGLLKKIRNSGEVGAISVNVVYENDEFDYWTDEKGDHIRHRPVFGGDAGQVKCAFALIVTKDNFPYIAVMTVGEIETIRAMSKATYKGNPWEAHWDEMAKKTVLRRLSKIAPMSTDIQDLIRADDDLYDLKGEEPKAGEPAGRPKRLGAILEAATKKGDEPRDAEAVARQDEVPSQEVTE